jgi:FkbH-like protein
MADAPRLSWLLRDPEWPARLRQAEQDPDIGWAALVALAGYDLDFLQTDRLDRLLQRRFGEAPPPGLSTRPVRLAVLGSCTTAHLHGAIRVAALRRGIWLSVFGGEYGQYMQDLLDPGSELHRFRPDAVLLAFDARHVTAGLDVAMAEAAAAALLEDAVARMRQVWELARGLGASVLPQTILPVLPPLLGAGEHRLAGSPCGFVSRLNARLGHEAEAAGLPLIPLAARAAQDGVRAWHDAELWHRAKQDITPAVAPFYGDLVGRVLAAQQGLSRKCLVLDLDDTIWGGVVGEEGVEGLVLGQGSALGEGFLAVQEYARQLSRRGIILAVCSKNDEVRAVEAFEKHPEMLLRRTDIAAFVANWEDKAANIRAIAATLEIGLDSLVFVDDNPFERTLVRRELPMVAVPEVPDDPALVPNRLADAGYFEALSITGEDLRRTELYQANAARERARGEATDMVSYLRSLDMRLVWRTFDATGLGRVTQLINRTNQFNLMTRRYTEDEVRAVIDDPSCVGLQLRLLDRFGDNGIIAVLIGRRQDADLLIDTWLMSCRVLGRQVEEATLALLAQHASRLGAARLIGEYKPTAKNGMVANHYARLGFTAAGSEGGVARHVLDLDGFTPAETSIVIEEG